MRVLADFGTIASAFHHQDSFKPVSVQRARPDSRSLAEQS